MIMADVLARFESWLQEHAPEYMESLAPGLAEARIDELGAKLGFELPEPVRTLYWWRDGDRDNGFHLCVDMGGAYGGRPGQVVEVWLKDEDRSIVAPDLTSWLDAQVASLEAGLWRFEEDDEQWEPADDGACRAFFAERLAGYPIEHSADELP